MVTPLVTAINRAYLPGVKALYNSYLANAGDGFEFHCIVDGDDELFDEIEAFGINTINPPKWADNYPTSDWWPEKIPSLFARLQIPRLFSDYERAIWIDADCVIVDSLAGLLDYEFTAPLAACRPSTDRYVLGDMLVNCPPHLREIAGLFAGVMIFNIPEWNRRDITGQCAEAMLDQDKGFKWADQSVLSYVLRGDFFELPMLWQTFPHRGTADIQSAKILHWLGNVPWVVDMRNQHLWEQYATPRK